MLVLILKLRWPTSLMSRKMPFGYALQETFQWRHGFINKIVIANRSAECGTMHWRGDAQLEANVLFFNY